VAPARLGKSAAVTDIIIGARKPRPRKSRRLVLLALASIFVYVAARWTVGFLTAYPNPDVSLAAAEITFSQIDGRALLHHDDSTLELEPVTVVRASGRIEALGGAHGRFLGSRLEQPTKTLSRATRGAHTGGEILGRLLGLDRGDWLLRHVDDGIPGHQYLEIAAAAKAAARSGSSASLADLVRSQAAFDIAQPDPFSAGAELRAVSLDLTVVHPLSGASGDRLLLARSHSTPGLAPTRRAQPVVRFFRPAGVIPFAAVGNPAMIGTLTGINGEGLAVIAHPLDTVDETSSDAAQPTPLLVRDILENARSAEQAVSIIEAAEPLGSAIYIIVDAASRTPVVVERTPQRLGVLATNKSRVVANLLTSTELADEPESERNRRMRMDAVRMARANTLLKQAPPRSPADLAAVLRDQSDKEGVALALGHRAQIADPSAQHVVIIDAAALVLWVNTGPGPFGRFVAFDLRHELRGEGKRGAPPPDIPESPEASGSQRVLDARSLLYAARRSAAEGRMREARETVARAQLLAPALPEAQELATQLGARAD